MDSVSTNIVRYKQKICARDFQTATPNTLKMLNEFHPYDCAFCGEENEVFVDGSGARRQQFTEDCEVCCRPNLLTIQIERDDWVSIAVEREYDA